MYDDPPDSEPNPCQFCEHELGYGDGCEHCATTNKLRETESALSTLRHRLACRTRWIAKTDPLTPYRALSPRFMEAVALVLDLAGLPLPEHYRKQAHATMIGEYGEHVPIEKSDDARGIRNVPDEDLVRLFIDRAHGAAVPTQGVYFAEVLDCKPATQADQIWHGDDENGVPRVWAGGEKRIARVAASTQWGDTLREAIEGALNREAKSAAFWVEFFRDYLRTPADLVPKDDPRFVRGGDQPKVSFVVGIEAYTAYVGRHKSEHWSNQGLGFGGAEFTVRLEDGREFFTDNNWSRGTVPPHLRKLIPSNAVFVRPPRTEVAEVAAAAAAS